MSLTRKIAIVVLPLAAACARTMQQSGDGITRLEASRAAQPASEPILRSLGVAYYKAGRLDSARSVLQRAASMDPKDGVADLYLGLTAESQNDFPAARAAYSSYLQYGKTKSVRNELQQRLVLLDRKELIASAKAAVAREAELGTVPGNPSTVAVLPFVFSGSDTSLKPLERGFAELLTTDLSRSNQLKVLDRSRIQAVLDEIARQQSGLTDSSSGVRVGRILQAGRLVGGSLQQNSTQLRADADLIVVQSGFVGIGPSNDQPLEQLFALERNIALALFDSLHVRLTTAERNGLEQRPTRSLAAFLSYSRGLAAEDAGQYDQAATYYQDAVRRDPSFGAAQQKSQETHAVIAAAVVSTASVESNLKGTSEGAAVTAATQGTAAATTTSSSGGGSSGASGGATSSAAAATAESLNPSPASAATASVQTASTPAAPPPSKPPQSATGTNNPTTTTTSGVTVVVHIPKP